MIAAVIDEPSLTLLSDLLLSRPGEPGVGNMKSLPGFRGSGDETPTGVHVVRMVRKIHQFSPTTVMNWAGQAIVASQLIEDLTPYFASGIDPKDHEIGPLIEIYAKKDVSFILASIEYDSLRIITYGTDKHDWPDYGKMITGGSGAGDFLSLIYPNGEGDYGPENLKYDWESFNTYWKPMILDVKFTALQALSKKQIGNAWGGRYRNILRECSWTL